MSDCHTVKITNTYERVSKDLQRETTILRRLPAISQALKNPEPVEVF